MSKSPELAREEKEDKLTGFQRMMLKTIKIIPDSSDPLKKNRIVLGNQKFRRSHRVKIGDLRETGSKLQDTTVQIKALEGIEKEFIRQFDSYHLEKGETEAGDNSKKACMKYINRMEETSKARSYMTMKARMPFRIPIEDFENKTKQVKLFNSLLREHFQKDMNNCIIEPALGPPVLLQPAFFGREEAPESDDCLEGHNTIEGNRETIKPREEKSISKVRIKLKNKNLSKSGKSLARTHILEDPTTLKRIFKDLNPIETARSPEDKYWIKSSFKRAEEDPSWLRTGKKHQENSSPVGKNNRLLSYLMQERVKQESSRSQKVDKVQVSESTQYSKKMNFLIDRCDSAVQRRLSSSLEQSEFVEPQVAVAKLQKRESFELSIDKRYDEQVEQMFDLQRDFDQLANTTYKDLEKGNLGSYVNLRPSFGGVDSLKKLSSKDWKGHLLITTMDSEIQKEGHTKGELPGVSGEVCKTYRGGRGLLASQRSQNEMKLRRTETVSNLITHYMNFGKGNLSTKATMDGLKKLKREMKEGLGTKVAPKQFYATQR